MSAPSDDSSSDLGQTAGRLVRRPPGLLWFLALLVVPVLLTAVLLGSRTGSIEDDLERRSLETLVAAGITGATVEFSGRDATVTAATDADLSGLRELVASVDGVRTARIGPQPPPEATTPANPSTGSPTPGATDMPGTSVPPFSISRAGGSVKLTGSAPDQAAKNAILASAQVLLPSGGTLVDEITVDEHAGLPDAAALETLVRTLAKAKGDVGVAYDGRVLTLTGDLDDQATKATAGRAAAATVPGAVIANRLYVPNAKPPREVSVCDDPQIWLDRMVAQNPVLFQAGTVQIAPSSEPTVARVAALLKTCAAIGVQVSGHTDNLGGTSNSVPLSLQRAIAVKSDLVRRGIARDRITVKGFGETRPIASNDTPAGRIVNRRVEFKVR